MLLGLEFFLFESLFSFPEVWDLTYRWKMACDSKVIIYISLDSGVSVKDYLRTQRKSDRNVREETLYSANGEEKHFFSFMLLFV